jgi:uncharacterized membrane protein (UPF0127 family)
LHAVPAPAKGLLVRYLIPLVVAIASAALPAGAERLGAGLSDPSVQPNRGLATGMVTLETKSGPRRYRVEIARSAAEQARGMMYRTEVPAGTGMLFPFDPPRPAAFWMRNTWVPLDIVFIGADGRILNIEADAVPLSETVRASKGSAAAVLELAGGEARRIGLVPGDRVLLDGKPLGARAKAR